MKSNLELIIISIWTYIYWWIIKIFNIKKINYGNLSIKPTRGDGLSKKKSEETSDKQLDFPDTNGNKTTSDNTNGLTNGKNENTENHLNLQKNSQDLKLNIYAGNYENIEIENPEIINNFDKNYAENNSRTNIYESTIKTTNTENSNINKIEFKNKTKVSLKKKRLLNKTLKKNFFVIVKMGYNEKIRALNKKINRFVRQKNSKSRSLNRKIRDHKVDDNILKKIKGYILKTFNSDLNFILKKISSISNNNLFLKFFSSRYNFISQKSVTNVKKKNLEEFVKKSFLTLLNEEKVLIMKENPLKYQIITNINDIYEKNKDLQNILDESFEIFYKEYFIDKGKYYEYLKKIAIDFKDDTEYYEKFEEFLLDFENYKDLQNILDKSFETFYKEDFIDKGKYNEYLKKIAIDFNDDTEYYKKFEEFLLDFIGKIDDMKLEQWSSYESS